MANIKIQSKSSRIVKVKWKITLWYKSLDKYNHLIFVPPFSFFFFPWWQVRLYFFFQLNKHMIAWKGKQSSHFLRLITYIISTIDQSCYMWWDTEEQIGQLGAVQPLKLNEPEKMGKCIGFWYWAIFHSFPLSTFVCGWQCVIQQQRCVMWSRLSESHKGVVISLIPLFAYHRLRQIGNCLLLVFLLVLHHLFLYVPVTRVYTVSVCGRHRWVQKICLSFILVSCKWLGETSSTHDRKAFKQIKQRTILFLLKRDPATHFH